MLKRALGNFLATSVSKTVTVLSAIGDDLRELLGRIFLEPRKHVGVGIQGDCNTGMAQTLADDLRVYVRR